MPWDVFFFQFPILKNLCPLSTYSHKTSVKMMNMKHYHFPTQSTYPRKTVFGSKRNNFFPIGGLHDAVRLFLTMDFTPYKN